MSISIVIRNDQERIRRHAALTREIERLMSDHVPDDDLLASLCRERNAIAAAPAARAYTYAA